MTRPLPVCVAAGQTADLCWICWRPLEDYTDGEGRVFRGCPPCRVEIERLQALESRIRGPLVRRGPPGAQGKRVRRWKRCPMVVRGDFPRESTETVGEEQRQDRVCVHCGCVSMRRLR